MTQKSTGGINKNYKHLPRRNFFKTGRCCRGADVMLAVAVSPSSVGRGQDFGVLSPPWSSRIRGMKNRRRPWMLVMDVTRVYSLSRAKEVVNILTVSVAFTRSCSRATTSRRETGKNERITCLPSLSLYYLIGADKRSLVFN